MFSHLKTSRANRIVRGRKQRRRVTSLRRQMQVEPLEQRRLLASFTWANRGQASDMFDAAFGAGVPANAARAVVDAAIDNWERVITDFNHAAGIGPPDFSVNIMMDPSNNGCGAFANSTIGADGKPTGGNVTINLCDQDMDGNSEWFVDPTPWEHSEFQGNIVNAYSGDAQAGSPAAGRGDLLTITTHELGHALGIAAGNLLNSGFATETTIADDAEGPPGNFWVFQGPSVNVLLTGFDSGNGGQDLDAPIHSAGPRGGAANNALNVAGLTLYGAQEHMNAFYEFGRRYLLSNKIALMVKDAFDFDIVEPEIFGTFYATLNESTGQLLVRGGNDNTQINGVNQGPSADDIVITRDGDSIYVSVDAGVDVPGTGDGRHPQDQQDAFVSRFLLGDVRSILVNAGDGNDTVTIGEDIGVPITVNGEDGHDIISGGDIEINGGDGNDIIRGSNLNDTLNGGNGNDTIYALDGNDTIDGGEGDDVIYAGSGDNTVASAAGDGNDLIDLSENAAPINFTTYGNDTVFGTPFDDTISPGDNGTVWLEGRGGNDNLTGGDQGGTNAGDVLYGGDGDDRLEGGTGQDQFFGGDGSDLFVWVAGDGTDLMEGGGGDADELRFIANDSSNRLEIFGGGMFGATTNPAPNVFLPGTLDNAARVIVALNSTSQDVAQVFLNLADVEHIDMDALGGSDEVNINNQVNGTTEMSAMPLQRGTDLVHTHLRGIDINLGIPDDSPDNAADTVEVHGRLVEDNIDITTPVPDPGSPASATAVIDVAGFAYSIRIAEADEASGGDPSIDTLVVHGQDGDDQIKAAAIESSISVVLRGNDGDDVLSADAIIFGGPGDDFIVGGAGDDMLFGNEGEDRFIGGGGDDTIDGGAGFDTIIIEATSGNDRIDVDQPDATTLRYHVSGVIPSAGTETDTLVSGTVEGALVVAGDGDDIIRVTPSEALIVAGTENLSLRFTIEGGSANASDRLAIQDAGLGDLTIHRQAADERSGTYTMGGLQPVVYSGIEFSQLTPLNSITGGTGVDGLGRLVEFKPDLLENNNSLPGATHLGSGDTINVDPTIDPAGDTAFGLPGDEDWYRFVAEVTGTLDVQVYFEQIGTLANGRAGLPGDGNLDLFAFDADGTAITGFGTNDATDDERIRLPVVEGQTYYVQVRAADQTDAINVYELTAVNHAPPVPYDLELDDLTANGIPNPPGQNDNSDTGRSQRDNITFDNTPQIYIRLDDDILLADLPGNPGSDSPPDEVIGIPFNSEQTAVPTMAGYRVAVFIEGAPEQPGQDPQQPIGFARKVAGVDGVYVFDFATDALAAPFTLADGSHFINAKVQIADPADPLQTGFGSRSQSLEIIVDTVAPPVHFGLPEAFGGNALTDGLHPDSDSGVAGPGNENSGSDRVTNDTTPTFWGIAEANAVIRAFVDVDDDGVLGLADVFIGGTVAQPFDGTDQFGLIPPLAALAEGSGLWQLTSVVDMNDPEAFPTALAPPIDGLRSIIVIAEDVAGNITDFTDEAAVQQLDIFVDTQGPQIYDPDGAGDARHAIEITGVPEFDLFDVKPSDGPTPLINSLTIHVRDLPNRVMPDFLYQALAEGFEDNPAEHPGHYHVVGDHDGNIVITDVEFIPDPDPAADGDPAFGRIVLTFAEPLPDDRFTLTISDSIRDPAGNALDGESNAEEPNGGPLFPSGDGQPGGDFVTRFTVDSRAEIGVWAAGSVYVDTNGNFVLDPEGKDNDDVNEDITYVLGFTSDNIFAGNFSLPMDDPMTPEDDTIADGFDKIAAYGRFGGGYRWLIDADNDGVPNLDLEDPSDIDGLPVAGDFTTADNMNGNDGDEVAIKDGNTWHLDLNGNLVIDVGEGTLAGNMVGKPVIGDFDNDGVDDLGSWADNRFWLDLSSQLTGAAANPADTYDPDINGTADLVFEFGFTGVRERPFAADFDGDGIDDLGLWVPDRSGATPAETAEWYILVSDGRSIVDRVADDGPDPDGGGPTADFKPQPFGADIYAQFSDDFAVPLVGNFDPPVTADGASAPAAALTDTNTANPLDVNIDGDVTPLDLLLVINCINNPDTMPAGTLALIDDVFVDVNADGGVSALDVLIGVNYLNGQRQAGGEGEAPSAASPEVHVLAFSETALPQFTADRSGQTAAVAALSPVEFRTSGSAGDYSMPDGGNRIFVVGRDSGDRWQPTAPTDSSPSALHNRGTFFAGLARNSNGVFPFSVADELSSTLPNEPRDFASRPIHDTLFGNTQDDWWQ